MYFLEGSATRNRLAPGTQLSRDGHWQAEAPLAVNSAVPLADDVFAFLRGSNHPFPRAIVRALYEDKAAFVGQFAAAARRAVDAGVLLPRDVDALVREAQASWPWG